MSQKNPSPQLKTYVFAANYAHFRYWCRINNISDRNRNYVYVADPRQLAGVTSKESLFIFYETWREHPKFYELWQAYKIIKALDN